MPLGEDINAEWHIYVNRLIKKITCLSSDITSRAVGKIPLDGFLN
ncbi:hypothetical protein PEC311524_36390 [Pectobacterium carotovorum subsp. carotovorum]|nr:hypothetical protein PEC311524_36390 [Pectobacterium carotovorum subsp. carotovorum]